MTEHIQYVCTESEAQEMIREVTKYGIAGLDTEFYGCDIRTESPVGRTTCHVFSVAVPSGPLLPRGFHESQSWVVAGSLLASPSVKSWLEDARFTKAVHNQAVDHHTIRNHGVHLKGAQNTLAMARFWWPHRAKREGFDLDSLGVDYCGAGKTESFDGLLGYDAVEIREHLVWKKRCACGVISCMKKKPPHDVKEPEEVLAEWKARVRRHIPLTDLNPSHPLWARYLAYAAWDAVLALWIYELMMREKQERPYPWQISL